MRLLVVGGGVSGLAATWALRRAGHDVLIAWSRAGATELSSGAVDGPAPSDRALSFHAALGHFSIAPRGAIVAGSSGALREARGADTAVLNLAPLAGAVVALAQHASDRWDAPWLARSLSESSWSRRTGTRFEVLGVAKPGDARAFAAAGRFDAWLIPSAVDDVDASTRLAGDLGCPVGETLAEPGGGGAVRYAAARRQLLDSIGATVESDIERLSLRDDRWWASSGGGEPLGPFDAVVLAIGGIVGGGVRLARSHSTEVARAAFIASLDAPVRFALDGEEWSEVTSLHGVDFQSLGVRALERVGIRVESERAVGCERLFVAGDAVADRARTIGDAVESGLRAAGAAAG